MNTQTPPRPMLVSSLPERTLQSSMMTMQSNAPSRFADSAQDREAQFRHSVELGKQMIAGKKLRPLRSVAGACQ